MAPKKRDADVCVTCFWAFPEDYRHIATEEIRRTDVTWQGDDVEVHDGIKAIAVQKGLSLAEFLRQLAAAKLKDG